MRRDPWANLDQVGNPKRPTRRCTQCGKQEGPRRDLRPTQFAISSAKPPTWSNTVHWACQACRRLFQGAWRIPSYHPQESTADFVCYAQQFVPDVRVLTLQEPWSWLLTEGFKEMENRKWHTVFSGRVFIHSAKSFADDYAQIEQWAGTHMGILLPSRDWLKANRCGRIVGVAEFGSMVAESKSPWKLPNRWAWPVNWCHPVNPTEPVRGMLGLWRLPTDNFRISVLPL